MLRIAVIVFSVLSVAALLSIVDGALELNRRIDRCMDDYDPAYIIDDAERAVACGAT